MSMVAILPGGAIVVADQGNNDKIIANTISGAGYLACPSSAYCVPIGADPSFTNNVKVHANVVN